MTAALMTLRRRARSVNELLERLETLRCVKEAA